MANADGKLIKTFINEAECKVVRVRWNAEWEEFRVTLAIKGIEDKQATYHTDCEDDAIGTAKAMAM